METLFEKGSPKSSNFHFGDPFYFGDPNKGLQNFGDPSPKYLHSFNRAKIVSFLRASLNILNSFVEYTHRAENVGIFPIIMSRSEDTPRNICS